MLRVRSRVVQLSSHGQQLISRSVSARVTSAINQRRYASADNVEYKPIKKLLVANRGFVLCRIETVVADD